VESPTGGFCYFDFIIFIYIYINVEFLWGPRTGGCGSRTRGGGWDRGGGGVDMGGRVVGGSKGEYRNIIVIFYSINFNYIYIIGSLFLFPLVVLIFILIVTKTS
jgi:hypothetical protein